MLGNLSKVLIKAPGFFNNHNNIIQNNQKESLQQIPEENMLDPFYQIIHIKNKENNINNYYFKEKDFWKKSLILDMNFNHNKRLLNKLNFSSKDNKKPEYEKLLIDININNPENKEINYFNKKRKNSNYSKNPPKTIRNEKNLNIYKQIFFLNKNNLNDNEINLKTESNGINDKNKTFVKTDGNKTKIEKAISDNILYTEENKNIKEMDNKEIKNKGIYKFVKNRKPNKSQESLFQDNIDKKLISLISVKPQIKEQLKSINRSMVGQRDYFIYQKSGRFNSPNPFYESMKKKEEMNILK
jgi:hypothetical protein